MGDNEKLGVREYINSKDNPPENRWQFLLEFFKTKEGLGVLVGIFVFLFFIAILAFIIIIKNPEIISVQVK